MSWPLIRVPSSSNIWYVIIIVFKVFTNNILSYIVAEYK